MIGLSTKQRQTYAEWSSRGFIVVGLGLAISFGLVGVRDAMSIAVPELLISVFALPSMAIIFFVGSVGIYPHVADAAPRLAIVGGLASGLGGAALIVATIGAIILQFTTQTGLTQAEENPLLLGLFFLMLIMFLPSFLIYGLASLWTTQPSRLIGILLLVAAVEPGSGLLFDVVGINLVALGPVITLGIAAVAMIAVGFFLGGEPTRAGRADTVVT